MYNPVCSAMGFSKQEVSHIPSTFSRSAQPFARVELMYSACSSSKRPPYVPEYSEGDEVKALPIKRERKGGISGCGVSGKCFKLRHNVLQYFCPHRNGLNGKGGVYFTRL